MVKALVSDGTRAMAHNLDDLYERWIERRTQSRLEQVREQPIAYHSYEIETFEDAMDLRREIIAKKNETELRLAQMKGGAQWEMEDHQQRAMLVAEQKYYNACLAWLKQIQRASHYDDTLRFNKKSDHPHFLAFSAAFDLLRLAARGIGFGEPENKVMDVIADYLNKYQED